MKKGITAIITGEGKGKTTSAFGMALRAVGQGMKVMIIQFFKKKKTGEIKAIKYIKEVCIKQFGKEGWVDFKNLKKRDRKLAQKGFKKAKKAIESEEYQMVILDEINLAVNYGLLNKNSVVKLIKTKPKEVSIVLTGRKADKDLIELADLVSEIENIKHPFDNGGKAKKGVEY